MYNKKVLKRKIIYLKSLVMRDIQTKKCFRFGFILTSLYSSLASLNCFGYLAMFIIIKINNIEMCFVLYSWIAI